MGKYSLSEEFVKQLLTQTLDDRQKWNRVNKDDDVLDLFINDPYINLDESFYDKIEYYKKFGDLFETDVFLREPNLQIFLGYNDTSTADLFVIVLDSRSYSYELLHTYISGGVLEGFMSKLSKIPRKTPKEEPIVNNNEAKSDNKKEESKVFFNKNNHYDDDDDVRGTIKKGITFGGSLGIFIIVLIVLVSSFVIIDTGERGVVLRFGEFKYVMGEGINFKTPFVDRVITMSIRDVTYNSKSEVSSKDMQTIQVDTTLIYSLDPNNLGYIYKTYGTNIQNVLIKPTMSEVVNAVVAEYNIESFVEKRPEISKKISDAFILKIQNSGINVKSLLITNHDFSDEYDKAIEAKKVAEQGALKAKYDLEKTRLDAEAQTLKQKSLNEMVLQEKAIDKWDGHLPTYMGDGRNLPFLIKQ